MEDVGWSLLQLLWEGRDVLPFAGGAQSPPSCRAAVRTATPFLNLKKTKNLKTPENTVEIEVLQDTEDAPEQWEM